MSDATPTPSWPAADPAARRVLPSSSTPLDQDRVQALLVQEWERFTKDTPGSGEHNARASKSLPLGVTSSFQHWEPYPISITSARGAHLTDVDGRQLLERIAAVGGRRRGSRPGRVEGVRGREPRGQEVVEGRGVAVHAYAGGSSAAYAT